MYQLWLKDEDGSMWLDSVKYPTLEAAKKEAKKWIEEYRRGVS